MDAAPQVAMTTPTTSRKTTRPRRNSPSASTGRSPREFFHQANPLPITERETQTEDHLREQGVQAKDLKHTFTVALRRCVTASC